jgi:hypothetical protein
VAEKRADGEQMAIRLEYRFDRLLAEKLAQAYELLVPERRGYTEQEHVCCQEAVIEKNGSDLRTGFLRSAKGGTYHWQPGNGTDPAC